MEMPVLVKEFITHQRGSHIKCKESSRPDKCGLWVFLCFLQCFEIEWCSATRYYKSVFTFLYPERTHGEAICG